MITSQECMLHSKLAMLLAIKYRNMSKNIMAHQFEAAAIEWLTQGIRLSEQEHSYEAKH